MMFGNDEYIKPLIYRDIIGPENTPMGMMMGGMYPGGMYPTNLLGGITMPHGPAEDTYHSYQQRKKKDWNFFTKAILVLGGLVALDLMKFKGLKNLFKKSGNGTRNSNFSNRFSTLSQKLKNLFKK